MKKSEIGEEEIVRCLSGYETLLRDIRERIQELYASAATTNDVLESLQMRGKSWSAAFSGRKGEKDLAAVLHIYEEKEKQYAVYLHSYMNRLMEEEEELNRIWICYQSLPQKQRRVLQTLYVEHKPWKTAKLDLRISHTTLSGYRNTAIQEIRRLYASDLSDLQIIQGDDC